MAATHALHAAIAPASELVDERRTLYRLAADLFAPGTELSDNLADHPLVRYEIGRALAGHGGLDPEDLKSVAGMRVRDASGLPVPADPSAADQLEAPLRIIAAPGTTPKPLTEAHGERFDRAIQIVAAGVELLRATAPAMAEDLLAHVSMIAVLDRETSGGVVSASSRYVPGLVLIDEPATPVEVTEALVHEGAHEKFFDLAMTREFLDSHAEEVEHFQNSWSGVRWPLEQVYAAFHAYSCLAQLATSFTADELGPHSLLPVARERAAEIGGWLLDHEADLGTAAQWLLRSLLGEQIDERTDAGSGSLTTDIGENDRFSLVAGVRFRRAGTGRVVVGREAQGSPDVYWLQRDPSWVVGQCAENGNHPLSFERMRTRASDEWGVDPAAATRRLGMACDSLVRTSIVGHLPG